MAVTYKDIGLLTEKPSVAGTEKIPVTDTQYITPDQIAALKKVHLASESQMPASPDSSTIYLIDDDGSGNNIQHLEDESDMPAIPDESTLYVIDDDGSGSGNIQHLEDESEMPATPDADTLYVIDESGSIIGESTENKVTSLSASSTDVQYPSAKCVYDELQAAKDYVDSIVGDIETLLATI